MGRLYDRDAYGSCNGSAFRHYADLGRDDFRVPLRCDIRFPCCQYLDRWQGLLYTLDSGKGPCQPPASFISGCIDAEIAEAENSLASGATLFAGGHGGAATRDAVEFKIAYLKKMKDLLEENKTAQAFVDAMKEAYPGLPGESGLEELSKALYK